MLESTKGSKAAEDVKIGDNANKKVADGGFKKKFWKIKSKEGQELDFYPIFKVDEKSQQVECRFLELEFKDAKGKMHKFTFDWLNFYMFTYYTCNEELRLGLAQRYERQVNYIPYNVEVQLSKEEKEAGIARRRVELPVDEITMAIARDEAWRMVKSHLAKGGPLDPRAFLYKKGRK